MIRVKILKEHSAFGDSKVGDEREYMPDEARILVGLNLVEALEEIPPYQKPQPVVPDEKPTKAAKKKGGRKKKK